MAVTKPLEDLRRDKSLITTPVKQRSSENSPASGGVKPRNNATSASNSKRPATNSPRTTPKKQPECSPKAPQSASPRQKLGEARRTQPSLLEDFLLGRPSPHRARRPTLTRRASLEAVKADMKAEFVAKIQAPSKVQDRVKQWQKSSAIATADKQGNVILMCDDDKIGKEDETKIKSKDEKKPPQKYVKSQAEEKFDGKDDTASSPKVAAPKKRVINDSQWMKENKKNLSKKGNPLPKNFLQATALNPPLEKKIQDWVRRTECADIIPDENIKPCRRNTTKKPDTQDVGDSPGSSKVSKPHKLGQRTTIKPLKEQEDIHISQNLSLNSATGDVETCDKMPERTRLMTSSRSILDRDSVRKAVGCQDLSGEKTSHILKESSPKSEPRNLRKESSVTKSPKTPTSSPSISTQKKSSGKLTELNHVKCTSIYFHPSGKHKKNKQEILSSSRPQDPGHGGHRTAKHPGSLNEISLGDSAFCVPDLPLGAEANSLKKPPPTRNPSFAVPKALKKAFNEGMRIVHDATETPPSDLSQPARIESWLNTTSDPFVGQITSPSASSDEAASSDRDPSYQVDEPAEFFLNTQDGKDQDNKTGNGFERNPPVRSAAPETSKRSNLEKCPLQSHRDLRRSQALRHVSSHKPGRKMPLKKSIISAFHGESAMKMPKLSSCDAIASNEKESNGTTCIPTLFPSGKIVEDPRKSHGHRAPERSDLEAGEKKIMNVPILSPRRLVPHPGTNRLSTIASMESSSVNSLLSQTETIYSNTTVTQDTAHTTPNGSDLSRGSRKSIEKTEIKKKLTRHSDLMSILSLPDTTEPGISGSIRSARSLRTTRRNHSIASIDDILIALADDEAQYMRELDTIVDGVIPVLIRCILSSDAAALFDTLITDSNNTSLTKPILDMGVALEKLRGHHKRIPLADAHALLLWADKARPAYEEYLHAWRSGFEDLVVNLAPASSKTSTALDEMKRDSNGDLLGEKGEKILVADLLKKPIIRIKYINRATKEDLKRLCDDYEALLDLSKHRIKEEKARIIDHQAWNADISRARNLNSLNPADKFEINRSYQVVAKDLFSLEMLHSTGQRINCGVELVLRDLPEMTHEGDLLIFKKDDRERFLLFQPIPKKELSARLGETREQVVVMVCGSIVEDEYTEMFVLDAEDEDVAAYWVRKLGENPVPPAVIRTRLKINPELASVLTTPDADTASIIGALKSLGMNQIPIGERPRGKYQDFSSTKTSSLSDEDSLKYRGPVSKLKGFLNMKEFASISEDHILDIAAANVILIGKQIMPINCAIPQYPTSSDQNPHNMSNPSVMSGGLDPCSSNLPEETDTSLRRSSSITEDEALETSSDTSENNNYSPPFLPITPCRNDGAPPPPVHRTPVSETLKIPTVPDIATPIRKRRRTSSPLKHEYQPSLASGSSSETSTNDGSYSDSSSEDDSASDCEEEDGPLTDAFSVGLPVDKPSPTPSILNPPDDNTAMPHPTFPESLEHEIPVESPRQIFVAVLFQWNGLTGKWISLHPEACIILVTDGLIECFEIDASGSSQSPGQVSQSISEMKFGQPIVKQTLTPVVQVRQSTAIDIEIKSAILTVKESRVSKSILQISDTLRYRLFTPQACDSLYAAVQQSRLRNKTYLRLEEEARIRSFGSYLSNQPTTRKRDRSIFGLGRKNSYRASTRTVDKDRSGKGTIAAITTFRRQSSGGRFNLSRSSVEKDKNGNSMSSYTKSNYTGSSYSYGLTPPHTPSSQAGNSESLYSSGLTVRNLGTSNISFRMYYLLRNKTWNDQGQALLTVSLPPPGMKQKSPLYNGPQKRITITKNPIPVSEDVTGEEIQKAGVLLDEVLGANLFVRMQKSGIMLQTWEDVSSNEESEGVRKYGSVAPKRHIWAMQFRRAGDAEWCWQLCRSGLS